MKKTMTMSYLLSITLVTLGGISTSAATYPNATTAIGKGEINFQEADSEIVDPTDPTNPVDPVDPTNPEANKGELRIQYVSDFKFGNQKKTAKGLTVNAVGDEVKEIENDNKLKDVPLYISTMDMRAERGSGWTLSVTSSAFKSSKGKEIEGGEVTLSNAFYAGEDASKPSVQTNISSKEGQVLTPGTSFKVAQADASDSKKQGIGTYSLAFGQLENDHSTGVTFKMGPKTNVETDTYTADFNWNLSPSLDAE